MSWVKPLVDSICARVPLEPEQEQVLREVLTQEIGRCARRQEVFEADATENYVGELLWKQEARRLRQAVADLSHYVEETAPAGELPAYVEAAMDALLPQGVSAEELPVAERVN